MSGSYHIQTKSYKKSKNPRAKMTPPPRLNRVKGNNIATLKIQNGRYYAHVKVLNVNNMVP